ncbi:MAG: iron ABC transporter permease [Desulfobacterales bacterium]|nr:iron ABC transporter permease [Desulfobacterales bacterium]
MHIDNGTIPLSYSGYLRKKQWVVLGLFLVLLICFIAAVGFGSVYISPAEILQLLLPGEGERRIELIIRQIRLPQALTAVVAGAGLACSGAVMQSVLRNPLASPFTLGISHAAAFGAALSVMVFGSGVMAGSSAGALNIPYSMVTVGAAFCFATATACIIIFIAGRQGASPQVLVLTGVALGSLFTAGTMLLQFFADDVQLAAMVFWTFGDLARADWTDLRILGTATLSILVFFLANTRAYDAMGMGDETAHGLGVRVKQVRLAGMMAASLAAAVIISFVGIISFIGLVAPHIVRRILGEGHGFLLPASMAAGGLVLLCADIAARLVLLPHVLPVSIFTSFLGAPVFIYLIVKGGR